MNENRNIPRILPYVLVRILPLIAVLLLGLGYLGTSLIYDNVSRELIARNDQVSDQISENLGLRLANLSKNIIGVAGNELIKNGIIDPQERNRYLPVFFSSAGIIGAEHADISLLNYRGVTLASSLATASERSALESHFSSAPTYKMNDDELIMLEPVQIAGSTEGAVIMRLKSEFYNDLFDQHRTESSFALIGVEEELIYGAGPSYLDLVAAALDEDQSSWQISQRPVDLVPGLSIVVGEPHELAFASARQITWLMWIGVVLMIMASAAGVFLAAILTGRPLTRLTEDFDQVTSFADLDKQVSPQGIAETQNLANAFNRVLSRLKQSTASRHDLMAANKELQRSNRELDDFAYIASHDLKEPLRAITNHATFLAEDYADKLDEDGRNRINRLKALSHRMSELISQLNYYARLGRSNSRAETVNSEIIIRGIKEELAEFLSRKNASVTIEDILPDLSGNNAQVHVLFQNLIVNGVNYNRSAAPKIEIGFAEGIDVNGVHFEKAIYVRDNGIGIDQSQQDMAFRIFKRLNPGDEFGGGTGVGLTFVKKIVEAHGGDLAIDSTPGVGTTIYFWLRPQEE